MNEKEREKMPKKRLRINSPQSANGRILVYRIWFGSSFYVGSSISMEARVKDHVRKINRCFAGKGVRNNSHTLIMNHLSANPEIAEGMVEILSFVDSEYELVQEEKNWLDRFFYYKNCLNYSNKTSRRINGIMIKPENAEKVQVRH